MSEYKFWVVKDGQLHLFRNPHQDFEAMCSVWLYLPISSCRRLAITTSTTTAATTTTTTTTITSN